MRYMLKHFYFIPAFVCAYLVQFSAFAVPDCPKGEGVTEAQCKQTAGCMWSDTLRCNYCAENSYFDTTEQTCKACPADTYPNSEKGSTNGDTDCYRGCQATDISSGSTGVASVSGFIYKPSGDAAEDKSQCEVVSCETSGGTCNMGYYKDGNSCKEKATITGTNLTIYGDTTTYVAGTTCTDANHTFDQKHTCGTTEYGICRKNTIPCKGHVQSSVCTDGIVTGDAELSGSSYNFTSCICKKSASIEKGSVSENCHFNSNGTNLTTDCTTTVSTCDIGYCSSDGSTCVGVPEGYYSIGTSPDCKSCPAGATSETGNTTGKNACHYTAATQFRDNAGTFSLPVGDNNITIKWSW